MPGAGPGRPKHGVGWGAGPGRVGVTGMHAAGRGQGREPEGRGRGKKLMGNFPGGSGKEIDWVGGRGQVLWAVEGDEVDGRPRAG